MVVWWWSGGGLVVVWWWSNGGLVVAYTYILIDLNIQPYTLFLIFISIRELTVL